MDPSIVLDVYLVPVSTILYVSYHVYLWWRLKKAPLTTVIGFNHVTRGAWVDLNSRLTRRRSASSS